jgi:pyruvate dehydrogenase E1 component alpha subunit
MASLWKLPVVYVLENNQYGEYTSYKRSTAGTGLARAEAMGIPTRKVDGNDVLDVYQAACWGVNLARSGEGPSFIECQTYRWRGHHMGDQGDTYGYRTQEEIEYWRKLCPINRHREYILQKKVASTGTLEKIENEVQSQIDQAIEFAKDASYPDPSEVFQDVYA